MKRFGYRLPMRVNTRAEVFDVVGAAVRDDLVLYLEFGVFEGASMRHWSTALKNPASLLHGFDSFVGLPEDFDFKHPKGYFDVDGSFPDIDDERITYFKGWFEDTLPAYEVPDHDVLVVNLDADLYSSTSLVLEYLLPHIVAGTFIYFDDFSRPDHEPRAFHEFTAKSGLRFEPVVADRSLNYVFFQCVGEVAELNPTAAASDTTKTIRP